MPSPSELEVAWLAGLLEGEGSFCKLVKIRRPKKKAPWKDPYIAVQLGMTDEDVVARAAALMGVTYQQRKTPQGRKMMYQCRAAGVRAEILMKLLRPWMGERRRKQIEDILEFKETVEAEKPEWPSKWEES
jgi:hypothetical protein